MARLLALTLCAGCYVGIEAEHLIVTGRVTLDGAPAAGWRVLPNDGLNSCSECGFTTDRLGLYWWGSEAPDLCASEWEVRVEPPDSLAGSVTPPFDRAPIACHAYNVRDFAFVTDPVAGTPPGVGDLTD